MSITRFTIYPAIDIRGGKCVRLFKGDYAQETVYGDSPVEVAKRWKSMGAEFLHLIDLDGAKEAKPVNLQIVVEIAKSTGLPVQLGGGIRNFETASEVLNSGIERIILGSSVLKDPEFTKQALGEFGDRVTIGFDCRDGKIAVEGWLEDSEHKAIDLALELKKYGLERVNYTDINRDGTLQGPNAEETAEFAKATQVATIVSGGISNMDDVLNVKSLVSAEVPIDGVIIGKALYNGNIDLEQLYAAL